MQSQEATVRVYRNFLLAVNSNPCICSYLLNLSRAQFCRYGITILDDNGKCLGQSTDKDADNGMRSCIIALDEQSDVKIIYTVETSGTFSVSYPMPYMIFDESKVFTQLIGTTGFTM